MFVLKYENNLYRCNKNAEKEQKINKRVFMGSKKTRGNGSHHKGKKELSKITTLIHVLIL